MTRMQEYLDETKFATQKIYEAIVHDEARLRELRLSRSSLEESPDLLYKQACNTDWYGDEDPSRLNYYFAEAAAAHENVKPRIKELDERIDEVSRLIHDRDLSIATLAGTILQYSKQALSFAFGEQKQWPKEPRIGSQSVADVIVAARNQSMHYEEGIPKNKQVIACFERLETEFGEEFRLEPERFTNHGYRVLKLLGLRSHYLFEKRMLSFCRQAGIDKANQP